MADKKWDDMMSDWQACKIAKVDNLQELEDIKKLEVKTHKKARSMHFFMWADIIGAAIILVVFIYNFLMADDLYLQIIFGGGSLILLPMAFLSVWLRKGAWEATGNDTAAYLNLALKRSISAIKLAKANAITALLAAPFFVSVVVWRGLTHTDVVLWPWNKYFFGSLFQFILFTGMFIGARIYQKRKEREKEKLEAMIEELSTNT